MNLLDTISTIGGLVTYLLDGVIVVSLIVAAIIGCRRSYRRSLANLLVYLVSVVLTIITGLFAARWLANFAAERLNFSLFIPSGLMAAANPFIEDILVVVFFAMMSLVIYAFFKSILSVFARNFDLVGRLFESRRPGRFLDVVLSIVFSVLNAYAHLLVVIAIFAFPFFNVVREGSISARILNMTPFVSSGVESMFQPFAAIQDVIFIANSDIVNEIFEGGTVNSERVADLINENAAMIQSMAGEVIPMLPEEVRGQATELINQGSITPAQIDDLIEQSGMTDAQIQAYLQQAQNFLP